MHRLEKLILLAFVQPSGLEWTLDRKRMKQVVANLVDNALKFSPASSKIEIRALAQRGDLCILVSDEGPGISPEDLPRIWDRLFRGDFSRSTQGFGLGLSIVRAIVSAHGGTASARAAAGGGTCFEVRVPGQVV